MEGEEIKKTLDHSLCIICQTKSEEHLVENPISHEIVLNFIEEQVKYGDWQHSETWKSLSGISCNQLAASKDSWHRKCYQDVAHTGKLKRIKERYERDMAGQDESRRKSNQLTRSKTMPYDRDVCFLILQESSRVSRSTSFYQHHISWSFFANGHRKSGKWQTSS